MDHFNNFNNTNLHSTSSALDEFDTHPFLGQTSANERAHSQTHTFTEGWAMSGQPGHTLGLPTSLFELASSATSHIARTHGYGQQQFPGYHWPMTGPYDQPYGSGIASRDNFFAETVALEASTVVPTPSSGPLNYWGDSGSGSSTSTFYENVQTAYQPRTGSTRTGLVPTWRFQPYGVPCARSDEHRNAEAGSSTLVTPPTTYLAPPTANPSGGISEATADAEINQTITEEDAAPTAAQPGDTAKPRDWRIRHSRDLRRLCLWAQRWGNLPRIPSQESALSIALEVVKTIRMPVYDEPWLLKGIGKRTAKGKKGADSEFDRRTGTRGFNEELSRYYQLPENQGIWACPGLLRRVLEDVLDLPKPPVGPSR